MSCYFRVLPDFLLWTSRQWQPLTTSDPKVIAWKTRNYIVNGTKKWITGGMCPEVFSVGGVVWISNGFMMVSQCRGGWDLPFMLGAAGVVPPHLQCKLLPKPSWMAFFFGAVANGVCQLLRKKRRLYKGSACSAVSQLFLLNTRYTGTLLQFVCSKVWILCYTQFLYLL